MNTYKENRLIQAPFDVEITCFDTKRLEQHAVQHPQPPIKGHGRKRKNFEVLHNAYEQGMIRICNTDTFCLFHALETARLDATETNRRNVRDMMIEAGIPRNLANMTPRSICSLFKNIMSRNTLETFVYVCSTKLGNTGRQ